MGKRWLLIPLVCMLAAGPVACLDPPTGPTPPTTGRPVASIPVKLEYDFRDGARGWQAGFADYAPDMEDMMQFESGIRPLPAELATAGTGYYLQGMNRSDDLFMFIKRQIGPEDGVLPNQPYRVIYAIVFASNAPSDAVGVGGPPGEAVFLKAGASAAEPLVHLDASKNYYVLSVDKGGGNSGEGEAASLIGHIANGLSTEDIDLLNPPYVSLVREHEHASIVTACPDGKLWLLVGTDSGFEGLTGIYYQRIAVTLEPLG